MKTIPFESARLSHVRNLKVDEALFRPYYGPGCSMVNCNAQCCRDGVFLDVTEKAKILEHADLVIRHMDAHQVQDPGQWFEEMEHDDPDFPSGRCAGTRGVEYGCVFLNSRGWCVLQKAAVESGLHKYALKPYFCVAYPLTIRDGVLTVEDGSFTRRSACCSPNGDASIAPVDVCGEELEFMLGNDGLSSLNAVRASTAKPR